MILTERVMATVSGANKDYFERKGYILPYKKDARGRIGIAKGTNLEVSVYDLQPFSNIKIKYKCDDCENVFEVHANTIFGRRNSQYKKTGETVCSRCANKRMSGKNNSQYKHGNNRYPEYRCNAKKRGIAFNLSIHEFESLTTKECHYCGGNSKDRDTRIRSNGIDRKDSNLGYQYENCVPCCATCNFIKNTMGYSDFINYIKQVYKKVSSYEV